MNIPIDNMAVITLDEMSHIRLMDRIDTKYVANAALLPVILSKMQSRFMVQVIDSKRIANYSTQYFDTNALDFFTMHQNGKLNRQKIRIRSYVDSNLSFLEIKNKNNKGRTSKKRIPSPVSHVKAVKDFAEGLKFLNENAMFSTGLLAPVLENSFQRMTFVNKKATERITIDVGLSFRNYHTNTSVSLDSTMILELKQDGLQHSDFAEILKEQGVRRSGFSKYCYGIIFTDPNCKYNRFKRKIHIFNKNNLINQSI
ncbi:MAG: polyphosphate polymerase domain-containing protein [Dysgonamonadaceae bacterium]|jgi:hypothetical protein|nr:polyphosphate polymerase domain-containing protein [Dysgonamonadaceae bacterium]